MDILELMYQRMWQIQGRIIQIRNYAKIDKEPFNKKDWKLADIPKLENEIEEMSVGISAIETFRRELKKRNGK